MWSIRRGGQVGPTASYLSTFLGKGRLPQLTIINLKDDAENQVGSFTHN